MELSKVDDVFGEVIGARKRHLDDSGTERGNVAKSPADYFFLLVKYES